MPLRPFLIAALVAGAAVPSADGQPRRGSRPAGARATAAPSAARPLYLDPSAAIDARVEDLLRRMTVEEKIGQMTQINYQFVAPYAGWSSTAVEVDPARVREAVARWGVGSFLNGIAVPAEQWIAFSDTLQRVAMQAHRLRIPVLYGIDHVHGTNYLEGGTVFPQQLNLAATFDTTLARRMGEVTALESASLGHHWNFAPILDLGRNVRWARLYETFGESPYVASRLGAAYVRGLQETRVGPHRVAATMKHFLGYSDPKSGWDRTPIEVPMQTIYEMFVPSFRAAVEAGAMTVMINSAEINGEPVHASKRLLTGLLRDELGFQGLAVTDWEDIQRLVTVHRVAATEKEATRMALDAGIDMSMVPMSYSFPEIVRQLVREGAVTEARLDVSVRRILRAKFALGLFETPMPSRASLALVGAPAHRASALAAAEASLTLLRNRGGVLPLAPTARVLVAGPSADSKRNLSGGWSLEWQGAAESRYPAAMPTVVAALRTALGAERVQLGPATATDRFRQQCLDTDVVVLAIGEEPYTEQEGNLYDLTLPESQRELIRAAAACGKPVVGVYVGGRPRTFAAEMGMLDAFVWAGLPGFEGGTAIARVLSGAVNPSGKLPFVYPYGPSHTAPHNHKPSEYALTRRRVAFDFGEGLSYTTFAYRDLVLSDTVVAAGRTLQARVTLVNTGARAGTESVLWFLTDEVGRITRPVRELKGFDRVTLQPGEARTVTFTVAPAALQYPDADGRSITEPGDFTLAVGGLSRRFRLR